MHESFPSLASLETKGSLCSSSRDTSSIGNGSIVNLFVVLFCRALVAHVGALTQWNSRGWLELVLTTGWHMAGPLAGCTERFLFGVATGLTHYRCLLCYKNGGAFGGPFPS